MGGNTLSILLLVPSVPFMVRRFLPELELEETGYASGALESVFHVGQLLGATAWGALADSAGRRPVMLLGLLGTMMSCVMFGLAENYTVALIARFMWGLLNANIGVAKTMLAEVSGREHKTAAFAAIGVVGGLGRLMGPSIGGLLAMPADEIGGVFDSYVWRRWPVLLPCIVAAILTALTLLGAWALLPETLVRHQAYGPVPGAGADDEDEQQEQEQAQEEQDCGLVASESAAARDPAAAMTGLSNGQTPVALGSDDDDTDTDTDTGTGSGTDTDTGSGGIVLSSSSAGAAGASRLGVSRLGVLAAPAGYTPRRQWLCWRLCEKQVLLATGLYGVIAFIGLASQECLPLLLLNNAEHGGLGMGPSQIGATIAAVGPALLLFQTLAYPRLCRWLGLMRLQWVCTGLFALTLVLTPWTALAATSPSWVRLVVATAINTLTTLARVPIFITTFMLIADASPTDNLRASVNGLGQSLCALGRILGPPLMTSLLAWSTSYAGSWPLNWHLVWITLAVLVVVTVGPILANIEYDESKSAKAPVAARTRVERRA
jgi:MFS family permease